MAEYGNQNIKNQDSVVIPGEGKARIYTVTNSETGIIKTYVDDKWLLGAGDGGIWSDTLIGSYDTKNSKWSFNSGTSDARRKYFSEKGKDRVLNNSNSIVERETYDALVDDGKISKEEASKQAKKDANDITNPNRTTKKDDPPQVTFALKAVPKQETQRDEMAGKPGQTLIYPQDHAQGDFDFIKIVPIEYVPQLQAGQTFDDARKSLSVKERYLRRERVVGSTMFLPMVPGISESNATEWGGDTMNPLQMAAGQVAANSISNLGKGKFGEAAKGLMSDTGTAVQNLMGESDALKTFITAYFAGKAVGTNLTGRAGIVVNPNLEVLFTGPKLRTFQYNFKFTPRDDREAKTVKTIIKVFKKAMAPKRRAAHIFLNVPSVFKIKYLMRGQMEHPFLNKIKPCAMTSFNIDYTPEGSYMTYGDGSMTSYGVSMNFAELEPIYNNDVQIDSDDMGY